MIYETIRTFDYCIDKASQYVREEGIPSEKHLILGNGFSIAFRPDIFRYEVLVDHFAPPQIKILFNNLNTSDFEYVMHSLTDALKLVSIYPNNTPITNQMKMDLVELRKTLIEAISQLHPADPRSISEVQYESCRVFLNHFESGNKYTFNYDLLLYWVYMNFLNRQDKPLKIGDGFCYPDNDSILKWHHNPVEPQTVYYLHGAMHLFNDGGALQKFSWVSNGISIKDQVCRSIATGTYPMFISEGTKKHKRSRIEASRYLENAFRSLDDIKDNLFIFGHSLGDTDDHVFDQVNSLANLKNIFISIFDGADPADKQIIIDKVTRWAGRNRNKDYYFYNAASANVWGP